MMWLGGLRHSCLCQCLLLHRQTDWHILYSTICSSPHSMLPYGTMIESEN